MTNPQASTRGPSGRMLAMMLVVSTVAIAGCTALQQMAALRNVVFSLTGVQNGRIAGVDLARVRNYSSLSAADVARLALAMGQRDVPLEMQVNVRAENPSDNTVPATMMRLAWSLFLNDRETVSGVVDSSVTLPPGQPRIIPVRVRLNLVEFFEGSAQDLVNIASTVAGLNADPTKISLRAVPTIDTPIGPLSYPSPITIVSGTVK